MERTKPSQPSQPSKTSGGNEQHGVAAGREKAMRDLGHLPCRLTVEVPFSGMTLSQALALEPGTVIDSHVPAGRDLELKVNGVRVGWGQGRNQEGRITVRVTDFD